MNNRPTEQQQRMMTEISSNFDAIKGLVEEGDETSLAIQNALFVIAFTGLPDSIGYDLLGDMWKNWKEVHPDLWHEVTAEEIETLITELEKQAGGQ
jgi:hypothetical protein